MTRRSSTLMLIVVLLLALSPSLAFAHCDTLDGPVIQDARLALEQKDVKPVLKWVREQDEADIRAVFKQALLVRTKGDAARDLADTYFFETLVRIHRAGEGAPYTGLKPAGSVAHIEAAADQALETGSVDKIVTHLSKALAEGIRERFEKAMAARAKNDTSVEAGRDYVHAYVEFLHYVAGLFDPITKGGGHAHEGATEEHGR